MAEILTVMAIIAILAALLLSAASGVLTKGLRSRASGEIFAIGTALNNYNTDNGGFPQSSSLLTNNYTANDGSQSAGLYQKSSQVIYLALTGQTNYTDTPVGNKNYMPNLKRNEVGDAVSGGSYFKDPWGYSYGYSTGSISPASYPYNGNGFFDLWSTGGILKAKVNTNAWLNNWQQQ
ncbi:MAG TPA: hypothetical protein VGZ93_05340 [Candidatus Methylacidiphilales bacterium]|nr:hypothetical protein [Candidatus Methylacidiphilales bacterium]